MRCNQLLYTNKKEINYIISLLKNIHLDNTPKPIFFRTSGPPAKIKQQME